MDQFPPPPPPPPVPQLPEAMLAPEQPEVPWRAREALLIVLLSLVTGGVLSALAARPFRSGDPTLQLIVVVLLEGSLGGWVLLWVKMRHHVGLKALGLRFKPSDIGAGVLAALLGLGIGAVINAIVLSIAQEIQGKKVETPQQLPDINQRPQWFLAFIAVVIVAPLAEEMFFRGFLYQALRRWRGVPQGVLLSALFFGIAHVSIIIIPAIFALGVILAYMFERRRSLGSTIAAHMTYNLIGFILIVVETSR
jgi:CAAX protease family protein